MAENLPRESGLPFDLGRIVPSQLRTRIRWGLIIGGVVLAFVVLSFLRSVFTDWLWFDQLGLRSVFFKVLVTRIVLFAVGSVILAIPLSVSLVVAHRRSQGPESIPLPEAIRDLLKRLIVWGSMLVVVLTSAIFGALLASQWELFLRFSNAVSFNTIDPVYGLDVSFYMFTLPLYEFAQGWLLGAVVVTLVATLALYFVNFSYRGVGFQITTGMRVQVSIIAALIMFVIGAGHWLDRWGLLLSEDGAVFGASYTDVNARMTALTIMTIIALAAGVLILVNGYMRGIRLLVGGVALWAVMAIVLQVLWPNAMQRFTVKPNEFAREQPYIERSIEFTRKAFGLDGITSRQYPVDPTLSPELVEENLETINNIRLWDRSPISSVYRFEQIIRPYYEFGEADVDRYTVDGKYRQVMLSAREVAAQNLPEESQSWVNLKLRYTHGFGLAMSPVTDFTSLGRPEFFAADIPTDGVISVQSKGATGEPAAVITNPRIYYGEQTNDYVIVNTNQMELDYYQAEVDAVFDNQYEGTGGVSVGSFVNQLAYAWQMGDINIFITGEITGESRIMYRRNVQERIHAVAPFLRLDSDPYIVAAEGRLIWVQDAYTVSNRYPYSAPNTAEGFNYIRNSVKVTVDAYDGTLRFYIADAQDPLVRTYQAIFPDLFVSLDEMSESLRSHIRYPQDLFGFQAGRYLKYHMEDAEDFYNLEDIWSLPNEKFGQSGDLQPVDPYYAIMRIPGEEREEFVLLIPFTRNEPNPIMAGWIAARMDGTNYGELVAFVFPKERRVKSPEQIEADIDTDLEISRQFTLLCQEGSFCIRGNLLVIPMVDLRDEDNPEFGLLYAEPIYLQAEDVEFPALKKVILATDEKVVMEDSIPEAIEALTGYVIGSPSTPADSGPPATDQIPAPTDSISEQVNALEDSIEALKKALDALEQALEDLKQATGAE